MCSGTQLTRENVLYPAGYEWIKEHEHVGEWVTTRYHGKDVHGKITEAHYENGEFNQFR